MFPVWKTAVHTTPNFGGRIQTVSAEQQQGARTSGCPRAPERGLSTASVKHSEGQDRCGVDTEGWNTVPGISAAGFQGASAPAECLVDTEVHGGPHLHLLPI